MILCFLVYDGHSLQRVFLHVCNAFSDKVLTVSYMMNGGLMISDPQRLFNDHSLPRKQRAEKIFLFPTKL